MEPAAFDGLTRQIGGGSAARRALLRALGVALLGGAAAPFRLADVAAKKQQGPRRPARQGHVQDERKHRKKRRKKSNKTPEPRECGGDERRCTEGTCVSQGACCPDERACDDGTCVSPEECCPATKRCDDGRCVSPCGGGKTLNPETCQCECPSGSVLMADGYSCCQNENVCSLNEAGLATTCCSDGDVCAAPSYCS